MVRFCFLNTNLSLFGILQGVTHEMLFLIEISYLKINFHHLFFNFIIFVECDEVTGFEPIILP